MSSFARTLEISNITKKTKKKIVKKIEKVVEEKMGLLGGGHGRLWIVMSEGRRGEKRKGEVGCYT